MKEAISVVGAGTMGSQMVQRLLDNGRDVTVFDVSSTARQAAADQGARPAVSAADAASGSEVCILSLPNPADVVGALSGPGGVLSADPLPAVIVDTSTVDQRTSQRAFELAAARRVAFVDAPVLGRPDGCGNWTLPVGGEESAIARARPHLEVLASQIVHVGPVGSGVVVKLLNNLMFAAINAITAECLAGAERLGVSPGIFVETVANSGAASVSNLFLDIGPRIVAADFAPAFTLALLRKDVELATAMLGEVGADTPLSTALGRLNERAAEQGLSELDTSALVQLYRDAPQTKEG